MDWGDTAEQAAFRAEVRAFVEARLPERYRNDPFDSGEHFVQWVFDRYSEEPELREAAREWAQRARRARLGRPHPTGRNREPSP